MSSKNTQSIDQDETSLSSDQPGISKKSGCWWKGAILAFFFIVALLIAQRYMRPDVDPKTTKPVVITSGENEPNQETNNGTEQPADLNLPEGAITASVTQQILDAADHPFDPLLELADKLIKSMDDNVYDYSATLVSQVSIAGKTLDEKYVFVKIRNAHQVDDKQHPFAVYTKFLKPKANAGQEAIWVEGQNEGKLVAHPVGLMNIKRFYLEPTGSMAMDGNLHPIQSIGMRNLLVELTKTGNKARTQSGCQVSIEREVDVNGRKCTKFQAMFPEKRDELDFHIARIYIDDEHNIPIAYEGYLWPEKEDGELPLIEKYYYTDVKLNVGLEDVDFDPGNEAYDYAGW